RQPQSGKAIRRLSFRLRFVRRDLPAFESLQGSDRSAMYFEPTIGDDEKELEWKIILQKNWFEDRLVWALNINYELEFEKADEGGYERDGVFEWFTGVSYHFIHNWSPGLEFWNRHEFADAT